jgi:hypothetical protein
MEADMDLNVYTLEYLVHLRLEELRASQEHWRHIAAERAERRALRRVLGHALVRSPLTTSTAYNEGQTGSGGGSPSRA